MSTHQERTLARAARLKALRDTWLRVGVPMWRGDLFSGILIYEAGPGGGGRPHGLEIASFSRENGEAALVLSDALQEAGQNEVGRELLRYIRHVKKKHVLPKTPTFKNLKESVDQAIDLVARGFTSKPPPRLPTRRELRALGTNIYRLLLASDEVGYNIPAAWRNRAKRLLGQVERAGALLLAHESVPRSMGHASLLREREKGFKKSLAEAKTMIHTGTRLVYGLSTLNTALQTLEGVADFHSIRDLAPRRSRRR